MIQWKTIFNKGVLLLYIKKREDAVSPYELGKKYFGKFHSGQTDRSVNHRIIIRNKIKNKKVHDSMIDTGPIVAFFIVLCEYLARRRRWLALKKRTWA